MYEHLASVYDHFVNWQSRLSYELPFILKLLQNISPNPSEVRVLDSACGTGQHAIALAKQDYLVSAADLAPEMVSIAQANAFAGDVQIEFKTAGFGQMFSAFAPDSFDMLLCLGNSLPHVQDRLELNQTLKDFARLLKPGGKLLIQMRNFDKVMAQKLRFMEPQSVDDGRKSYLFYRFYDFLKNGKIRFNILSLQKQDEEAWTSALDSTVLYPIVFRQLLDALNENGFSQVISYGNMAGQAYDQNESPDLVLTATFDNHG